MAYESPGRTLAGTQNAAADLSANQYRFVRRNGSGLIALIGTAGQQADGVLQNKPKAARNCTVMETGISKVVAGAAVPIDSLVMSDVQGRAVVATTGLQILGRALIAAGAAGEIISVDLSYRGLAP